MSTRMTFRLIAVSALFAAPCVASAGCGDKPQTSKPEEKEKKKDPKLDPKVDPKGDPKVDPKVDPKLEPFQPPRKVDLDSGVGKAAVAFLKSLAEGTAKADRLTAGFAKMIGVPLELESDKAKGYSADAAESWMKRVGSGAVFALPNGFAGADAAVLRGSFQAPDRVGGYYLRLVNENNGWMVDYLALSSVPSAPDTGAGPEAEYQRFAATAAASLLCDKNGSPRDQRVLSLAASLTPALRKQWAAPLGSDPGQGFDYNRGTLQLKAGEIGSGAESFAVIPQPAPGDFRLEITKAGAAKTTWLIKLEKGNHASQWLVASITAQ